MSYQTGWLKTHYTSEYLAANLSCSLSDMNEIKKIMADCKMHGIKVLNPDVNESAERFMATKNGDIRFGLGGMKGFGSTVVAAIIKDRDERGPFQDVWDFMERLSGSVNTKALETLVSAGAFDSFGYRREQFFQLSKSGERFIDELVHYADLYRNDKMDSESSLFGDMEEMKPVRPEMPAFNGEEDILATLQKEKEYVGMYLSSHPLDRYRFEIDNFTDISLANLPAKIEECDSSGKGCKLSVAGIVTDVKTMTTKSGAPGAKIMMEDYNGSYEFALFGKDYQAFLAFMQMHAQLYITGEIAERYFVRPEDRAQGKKAPFGFKIKSISLLGNISEEFITGLVINIDSSELSPEFRKSLTVLLKENKGKVPLSLRLTDKETGYKLEFHSKKYQVCVSADFIDGLGRLGLSYSVNKKMS